MEEEIDLRDYIEVLIRHWKLIAGATLAAVITATVISFTMPPTYEATATLMIPPEALATELAQGEAFFEALLLSTTVEAQVREQLGEAFSGPLLERVTISRDREDKSLLYITARAESAEKAATIANAWAEMGGQRIETAQSDALEVEMLEIQAIESGLKEAEEELEKAEDALRLAGRESRVRELARELQSKERYLQDQQIVQGDVQLALQQAKLLEEAVRRGEEPPTSEILLGLEIIASGSGNPFLFQSGSFPSPSRDEQIHRLNGIVLALEARGQVLAESIEGLLAETSALDQEVEEKKAALDGPERARDLAQETYAGLVAKLQEARVAAHSYGKRIGVLREASPPKSPIRPRKKENIALAGVIGLMVGVGGAFMVQYFERPRQTVR